MQFVFYAVILIVAVSVISSYVQNIFNPPVEISESELPENVQQELKYFPNFAVDKITFIKSRNIYAIEGTNEGRSSRIDAELRPNGAIDEFEYRDVSGQRRLESRQAISPGEIPSKIAAVMDNYLDEAPDGDCFTSRGTIGQEVAYKIKLRSLRLKYEFVITDSGRLVEYEKELRN